MTTFNFGNTWVPTSILIEIFEASDRAAIIVGVALIDNAITHRIKSKLLPPSTSKDSLFDHDDRPLQSLSAKINLAERLGLITPQFARLLHRARDIRNKFAHQVIVQDNVIDKCNSIIKDYFYIKGNVKDLQIELAGSYYSENSPVQHLLEQTSLKPTFALRIILLIMLAGLSPWDMAISEGIRIDVDKLGDSRLCFGLYKLT
jgi:hypothetical protein